MEEALREIEEFDGLRMSWNVLPVTQSEDYSLPVPITALYTPLQECEMLKYEPIFCPGCRSLFNCYSKVYYDTKDWDCLFCNRKNKLPSQYYDITPENLPLELVHSTVEYLLTRECNMEPYFFFIVDICPFDDQRYQTLIEGIKITYEGLPEDAMISLITFGTNINLIDFKSPINRIFLFSGQKEYKKEDIDKFFIGKKSSNNLHSFFIEKRDLPIEKFLNFITKDTLSDKTGSMQTRCTGAAISFATSLLETIPAENAIKMFLFTEGPITTGPGQVCDIKDRVRSATEIIKDKINYTTPAMKFYDNLANRMVKIGASIDIISATLIDMGLYEMQPMFNKTGGLVVMGQDLDHNIFCTSAEKNVKKNEDGVLDMAFNVKFKIQTKNIKYKKGFGIGSPLLDNNNKETGWKIGCLQKNSNVGFIFEPALNMVEDDLGYFQIITQYQRSDKKLVTRVTTAARSYGKFTKMKQGFDQEAAIVVQARIFTFGIPLEDDRDLIRRLDRSFMRFIKRFSESRDTLKLPLSMSLYPNLSFFLRRSLIVQSTTNTPDETFYYRLIVGKEPVRNAMTLIHPVLKSFDIYEEEKHVPMDATSLEPDKILLLDTFHNVLIWYGEHIHQWIEQNLHLDEQYAFLKNIMNRARMEADKLVNSRLPTPQFTITEKFGSQERILLAKVNPSVTKDVVVSENIDYQTFYDSVCKILKND
ncbi:Vesicle coat complex COPII, subunit SEC23 [Pseudoloma neurophilia]|uniref:Protein transport protein SEC23 n=1 Tax=Pseudoloma neurophilia TaxID=146866 RepID=A0A0R0LVB1_9MICR|nr:Vesicle coat complex COPII, subunit SEC23 [Pseudoloma neurophilia]